MYYFGFTPVSFTDGVTNAINDAVFEAIDELLVVQLKRGVPKDVAVSDLKNVLAKLQSAIDRNFDLFELYALANIFHIPEGVWIPTDKTAVNTYGRTEEQNIDDEVQRLKSAIKTEKMRQAVLEVEGIKLEEAKVTLTKLTQKIDALTKLCVENDVQNIGEHVAFVCESANELQKEVGNLMAARRAGLRPRAKKQAGVRPQHPVQALSSKDVQTLANVLG
ncbi:hypothetical protein SARC_00819 [Sphaeroforma arctica JP610]|uniref:Protein MIS12 homolog n=1 Tax=Sphaeroforma arctica JP610 TaxID=667725 RepID=A0A0L0GDK4_9EUKA|nr:hypothetical protein SARC_00819 [Sphaeroforma arctica JP610]KNC87075.1 hypothetical protein SARC_00819 [Sphaeroforma arctica JP610]|eukprot:XP_014160977.1 hypothetical protein SARC_00819 [Sphaeroforma arctica JP610]